MAEDEPMPVTQAADPKASPMKDGEGGYWLPSAVALGKEALPLYHAELTRAISAYNLRHLDEAELILKKLVAELEPLLSDCTDKDEAAAFHLLYAQVLTARGRTFESRHQEDPQAKRMFRKAETEFTKWIDRFPNATALVYCDYGVSLFKLGSKKRTIKALEAAREKGALNAEAYRYLGICYCQMNEVDKAKECFDEALKQEPGDFLTRKALAECLESHGRIDEALTEYNHVALFLTTSEMFEQAKTVTRHMLELAPKDPTALVRAGETLLAAGQPEEALETLDEALKHQPKNPVGIWLKGLALYLLGRYAEAVKQLQRALKIDPSLYKARIKLASALNHLNKFPAALEVLDEALTMRAGDSEAIVEKANALSALDRDSEALEFLDQAVKTSPDDARLLVSKGQVLTELGEYKKAERTLKSAVKLNPGDPKVHAALGQAQSMLGKHEDALNELTLALAIQPNYVPALMFKGETLRDKAETLRLQGETLVAKENNQEALQVLNQALALPSPDRERAWALGTKGQVLRALGMNDEAVESLSESVRLDGSLAWAHGELIAALHDLARLQETLDALASAVKQHEFANWFAFQGQVLNEVAEFELAVDSFDKAIALDPHSAQTFGGKGWALENLRKAQGALASYRQAEKMDPKNLFWQLGIANSYYLEKNEEKAAERYTAILNDGNLLVDTERQAEALGLMAWCNYRLKKFDEAVALFTDVLSMTPDVSPQVFNLAVVLISSERSEQGLREYKRGLRVADAYAPLARRGLIFVALDDFKLAIESNPSLAAVAEVKEAESLLEKTYRELPRYMPATA